MQSPTPEVLRDQLRRRSGRRLPFPARQLIQRYKVFSSVGRNVEHAPDLRVGRRCSISAPHRLVIGRSVSVGPGSIIQVDGYIGDFCMIGQGVQVVGRDDHATDEVGMPFLYSTYVADRDATARDAVTFERDTWFGGGSIVMSGVTVGRGSLVGAGSVVTRDVPPFTIVAGHPAQVVRRRFATSEAEAAHDRLLDDLVAGWSD